MLVRSQHTERGREEMSPKDAPAADHYSSEQLIADLIAAWNTHDLDQVTAFFAADYEGRDVAQVEPQHGRAGIRWALARYLHAVPDVRFVLDDLVVASDR